MSDTPEDDDQLSKWLEADDPRFLAVSVAISHVHQVFVPKAEKLSLRCSDQATYTLALKRLAASIIRSLWRDPPPEIAPWYSKPHIKDIQKRGIRKAVEERIGPVLDRLVREYEERFVMKLTAPSRKPKPQANWRDRYEGVSVSIEVSPEFAQAVEALASDYGVTTAQAGQALTGFNLDSLNAFMQEYQAEKARIDTVILDEARGSPFVKSRDPKYLQFELFEVFSMSPDGLGLTYDELIDVLDRGEWMKLYLAWKKSRSTQIDEEAEAKKRGLVRSEWIMKMLAGRSFKFITSHPVGSPSDNTLRRYRSGEKSTQDGAVRGQLAKVFECDIAEVPF